MLKAREFPLAKLSGTFSNIRVVLSGDIDDWKRLGGSKAMSINVIRGQLNELCTGHSSANPESAWAKILQTDMDVIQEESREQEK
jgi:hypothetical protein